MKRYIRCETESKLHIDPVSKTLVKPDIDIGGRKYDAEDQVAAIDYMYGYDSLPKARKAIVDGKYSEDEIKRAILYKETEGLPFKERKDMYEKNLKKFGLYKEDAIEGSTILASSFDDWYDSLSNEEQDRVDSLADEMGLPLYSECSESELSTLHDSFTSSNVTASTDTDTHLSGCSFDFDLGNVYDGIYLDRKICDMFDAMGLYCKGVDFRAVKYPEDKLYSQCQVDFEWSGSYDDKAIEDALETLIDDEGGNFLGIDFYSLDPLETPITAAVKPWKVQYEVHWISPDGKDCLLGGANDIDEVNAMAINQANELYNNPFETPERKVEFLLNLYIAATGTEDDAMLTSTEDYIDDLIRRIRKEV